MTTDTRVRATAALCGLVAVGGAAAGFLDGVGADVRAAVVMVGVWVCPALLILPMVRRFASFSRSALAASALFLCLSLHAVVSECFRVAGASFASYANAMTWALLVLYLVTLVGLRMGRGEPSRPTSWRPRATVFVIGVAALVVIAALSRRPYSVSEDAFDHIGFVRRIVSFDSMRPDHLLAWPIDATGSLPPDPRKGALHPTIAWIGSLADADPALVWSVLPLLLYPAFVLGFVAFSQTLVASRGAVAACTTLFLLSHGGTAFQLSHAAAYGQNLAGAWYWVLAAVVLGARAAPGGRAAGSLPPGRPRIAASGEAWRLAAVAILGLGGGLTHVGVAFHAFILALSLVVFARWLGVGFRRALATASLLVVAVGAGVVIRFGFHGHASNWIHGHIQGVLFVGRDFGQGMFVVSPLEILRQQGMAFLGALVLVPVLVLAARRRRDARAVLALGTLPLCISFVPPIATTLYAQGSYMVSRSLLNIPAFAGAVIVVAWVTAAARRRGFAAQALTAAVLAAWALAFVEPSLEATIADATRPGPAPPEPARALVDYVAGLPGGSTVLSDPATAYALSAFSSHRFVAIFEQHANPYDLYALDRLQAVRDVISPFASAQQCADACRRFGVDFVVVSSERLAEHEFMPVWDAALYWPTLARLRTIQSLQEVYATESFVVFRAQPASSVPALPERMLAPVFVASPELAACTIVAPDRAFEVTGMAVTPSPVAAGDSVSLVLGMRRDEVTAFGVPLLLHFRFDHESVGRQDVYPGEKQVRRFQERRRGVVTRFRVDARPGQGVFDPDLWPLGAPLCERFDAWVPPAALPGNYRVEVQVVRDSLLPNFQVRDLLFNRDHYSGTPCGSVVVQARAPGPRP